MEVVTVLPSAREQTIDLKKRLWQRFNRDHCVLFEVPVDGMKVLTSASGNVLEMPSRQSIDAVAMGLWRKTNHIIHGFEIKVSRADLKSELNKPHKHLAALEACDRFWLVVPSLDLIKGVGRQENLMPLIPERWGIMSALRDTLYTRRQAQPLELDPTKPLDRRFVAGLVQTASRRHGDPVVAELPQRRPGRRKTKYRRRAA